MPRLFPQLVLQIPSHGTRFWQHCCPPPTVPPDCTQEAPVQVLETVVMGELEVPVQVCPSDRVDENNAKLYCLLHPIKFASLLPEPEICPPNALYVVSSLALTQTAAAWQLLVLQLILDTLDVWLPSSVKVGGLAVIVPAHDGVSLATTVKIPEPVAVFEIAVYWPLCVFSSLWGLAAVIV